MPGQSPCVSRLVRQPSLVLQRLAPECPRAGSPETTKPRKAGALQEGRRKAPGLSDGGDAHRLAVLRALHIEGHLAIDQREQRVVAARADVGAGMEARAALTDDD